MVGTVAFNLDPPDGRAANAQTDVPSVTPPDAEPEAMVGPAVPAPPRLPYAPGPGPYTQLWSSQSATTMAEEMKYEMEAYRKTYKGAAPDYPGIQTTIVNSPGWMGFLTVLSGNQVVLVHSLGLFSSGLGSPTPVHNRIFRLVGERVGSDLPPIAMAPSPGLVPWLKIQARYRPDTEELMALDGSEAFTIPRPAIEADGNEVSVQNI
jgi:hypothetical protein